LLLLHLFGLHQVDLLPLVVGRRRRRHDLLRIAQHLSLRLSHLRLQAGLSLLDYH
jgi:hypothetical protein